MLYFKFDCKKSAKIPTSHKKNRSIWNTFVDKISKKLSANPDFEDKIQYVVQWYIEYDEACDETWREIGLDFSKKVIVKMPDERNYGFWLDTNCTIDFFRKELRFQIITEHDFNALWNSVYYDKKDKEFRLKDS